MGPEGSLRNTPHCGTLRRFGGEVRATFRKLYCATQHYQGRPDVCGDRARNPNLRHRCRKRLGSGGSPTEHRPDRSTRSHRLRLSWQPVFPKKVPAKKHRSRTITSCGRAAPARAWGPSPPLLGRLGDLVQTQYRERHRQPARTKRATRRALVGLQTGPKTRAASSCKVAGQLPRQIFTTASTPFCGSRLSARRAPADTEAVPPSGGAWPWSNR